MNKIKGFYRSAKENANAVKAAVVTGAMTAGSAFAAVDTAPITATLTDIAAVGAAMFGAYVAIKATKLVRSAL